MSIDRFAGLRTDRVFVITDPLTAENAAGNHMGYLRSLPYLHEQGIARYTFPPGWLRRNSMETFDAVVYEENGQEGCPRFTYRALSELPFEYTIIPTDQTAAELSFDTICQLTSQATDEYSDADTTHKLLQAYLNDRIDELFLVTDQASFNIETTVSGKPLAEEIDHVEVLSYSKLAKQHLKMEFDEQVLPLGESLNIWLHRAAAEYVDVMGKRPGRIADLFHFDELKPGIRTWDLFEFLATDIADQNPDHINATVRPWVESDITKIEERIRNALQEFQYDRDLVRRFRETGQRPD